MALSQAAGGGPAQGLINLHLITVNDQDSKCISTILTTFPSPHRSNPHDV
jgi:hypothetical protein